MMWLLCALVVCVAAHAEFVSEAWGVKLYESGNAGVLTFTLVNENSSSLVQYRIETWSAHERGAPVRRSCAIYVDNVPIGSHSAVKLPAACKLPAEAVSHSSRIVAVRLANGWKWRVPARVKVTQ